MGNKIRKLSKEIYLIAVLYTIILIAIGFSMGYIYDRYLTENIQKDIETLSDLSFTSEILYALEGSDEFCAVYPSTIKRVEEQTWRLGVLIDKLEKDNRLDSRVKMRYFDMELRDYFLTKRAKEKCGIDSLIILYFYTNDRYICPDCSSEGYELTIARNKLVEMEVPIKIYAFDGEAGHEIVDYLKKKYEVKEYPTLIIMYDNKVSIKEGFTKEDEIVEEALLLAKSSFS